MRIYNLKGGPVFGGLTNIGDDTINVTNNSQVIAGQDPNSGSNDAIFMSSGNDSVTIENSIILGGNGGDSIDLGSGDDTVTLGTGAELIGIIDCERDFDTIIFAMDVPEGALALISSQLATKDPAGDSITINFLFYEWEDCELLVNELVGVRNVRPIPTLSEWGLIALAGILGIVGFMVIRRRKVTA